jgi:hypothetical protein
MQTSEQENGQRTQGVQSTALLEEQAAEYESKLQVQQRQIQEELRRAAALPLMAAASTYVETNTRFNGLVHSLEETSYALRKETLRRHRRSLFELGPQGH